MQTVRLGKTEIVTNKMVLGSAANSENQRRGGCEAAEKSLRQRDYILRHS